MLRPIAPDDLTRVWDTIRPGIEACRRADYWRAEDVYHAIASGTASLHIGEIDRAYAGFVVLVPKKEWGRRLLHVWCLYSATKDDVIARFWPDVLAIAHSMSAQSIVMGSNRAGWARRLQDFGFKPAMTDYEMKL